MEKARKVKKRGRRKWEGLRSSMVILSARDELE